MPASLEPIVITGMGPGGLAAALATAKKFPDQKIILIEPRAEFTRGPRIRIDPNTLKFLYSFEMAHPSESGEKFFSEQINGAEFSVQIKDLQRYLYSKLEKYPNIEIIQGNCEVKSVNPEHRSVRLNVAGEERRIIFSHLVSADGAQRNIVKKSNKNAKNKEHQFNFNPLEVQPRQMESGALSFQVPKDKIAEFKKRYPDGIEIDNTHRFDKFTTEHLKLLKEFGWDKPYFPNTYIFTKTDSTKFLVAGEIPPSLKSMPEGDAKNLQLQKWGQLIIQIKTGIPSELIELQTRKITPELPSEEKKSKEAKNKLARSVFDVSLEYADKPCVKLENGAGIFLIGDTYKNADFLLGHGLNDAIADGQAFANNLGTHYDFDGFTEHQNNQLNFVINTLQGEWSEQSKVKYIVNAIQSNADEIIALAQDVQSVRIKSKLSDIQATPKPNESGFDPFVYHSKIMELAELMRAVPEQRARDAASSTPSAKLQRNPAILHFNTTNTRLSDEKLAKLEQHCKIFSAKTDEFLRVNMEQTSAPKVKKP
jgi:2-polyprenyl-6-methoxyphenol hydroxylase-like FAD-dependent oxidoreductase